jgi:hypothetical protein
MNFTADSKKKGRDDAHQCHSRIHVSSPFRKIPA